jgi:hypothetical protein
VGAEKEKKGSISLGERKETAETFVCYVCWGSFSPFFFYFINIMITIIFRKTFSFSKRTSSDSWNPIKRIPGNCRNVADFSLVISILLARHFGASCNNKGRHVRPATPMRENHITAKLYFYTPHVHIAKAIWHDVTRTFRSFFSHGVEESLAGRCFFFSPRSMNSRIQKLPFGPSCRQTSFNDRD